MITQQAVDLNSIATKALADWFVNNTAVTSLEFKLFLQKKYPEFSWTQDFATYFLRDQTHLKFTFNGTYRTYQRPASAAITNISSKLITLTDVENAANICLSSGGAVTKTQVKTMLRQAGYNIAGFRELFNRLGLQHNGQYTSDNHKIWVRVPTGAHLSKSKGQVVDINSMPKPYLKNALGKISPKLKDILNNDQSEAYKLLQAYFTFDIRQVVNNS